MSSLDAVAVETVMEAGDACADAAAARAVLAAALAGARAPKRTGGAGGWLVDLRIESGPGETRMRSGIARIIDDAGALVAERTVADRAETCTPLARAVAAWASLVLDDETARARDAAEPTSLSPRAASSADHPPGSSGPAMLGAEDRDQGALPPPPKSGSRTVEIGMMAYVRDGLAATSGFAGASPFVTIEVSPGWFLRPALAFGSSTAKVPIDTDRRSNLAHLGVRSDACRRIPGNYIERRGIELDLCFGAEVGQVTAGAETASASALRASAGPSAALRGELGAHTNLELRVASGYNFDRSALVAEGRAPALYGALELGLSWRLR